MNHARGRMSRRLGQYACRCPVLAVATRFMSLTENASHVLQRQEYLQPHELVWHGYWPAHPEWDNPSRSALATQSCALRALNVWSSGTPMKERLLRVQHPVCLRCKSSL